MSMHTVVGPWSMSSINLTHRVCISLAADYIYFFISLYTSVLRSEILSPSFIQTVMQSYKQYWHSLPVDHSERSSSKRTKRGSRPINPGNLPFDSSRLPVIARKRIRRPMTPPRTPEPLRPSIGPRQSSTSNVISSPNPTPSLYFYGTPQTPSFRSSDSSTPSGSTLLTPTTPSQGLTVRIDTPEITPSDTHTFTKAIPGYFVEQTTLVKLKVEARSSREDTPTPRMSMAQKQLNGQLSQGPGFRAHAQAPILLRHVSSSGGPLAALRRYDEALRLDSSFTGMSLFLNCPKKRVPFPSELQLAKYRLVAEAWKKSQNRGGGCSFRIYSMEDCN